MPRAKNPVPKPRVNVHPGHGGIITSLNKNDVLSGRGGRVNKNPGNVTFRLVAEGYKREYLDPRTPKLSKAHVAARLVAQIRSSNPPGRFLMEDPENPGGYVEIGDEKAWSKVGQALREGAAGFLKEIEGGLQQQHMPGAYPSLPQRAQHQQTSLPGMVPLPLPSMSTIISSSVRRLPSACASGLLELTISPGNLGFSFQTSPTYVGAKVINIQAKSNFRDHLQGGDKIITIDGKEVVMSKDVMAGIDRIRKLVVAKQHLFKDADEAKAACFNDLERRRCALEQSGDATKSKRAKYTDDNALMQSQPSRDDEQTPTPAASMINSNQMLEDDADHFMNEVEHAFRNHPGKFDQFHGGVLRAVTFEDMERVGALLNGHENLIRRFTRFANEFLPVGGVTTSAPAELKSPQPVVGGYNATPPSSGAGSQTATHSEHPTKSQPKQRSSTSTRRKCNVDGCPNRVVQGGLCISHGAKRKTCSHPGCTKNVKKAGLCSTHGPARKRCEFDGCTKVAVRGGRCIAHGANKKICSVEKCTKQATLYAYHHNSCNQLSLGGFCKKHHDETKDMEKERAKQKGGGVGGTHEQRRASAVTPIKACQCGPGCFCTVVPPPARDALTPSKLHPSQQRASADDMEASSSCRSRKTCSHEGCTPANDAIVDSDNVNDGFGAVDDHFSPDSNDRYNDGESESQTGKSATADDCNAKDELALISLINNNKVVQSKKLFIQRGSDGNTSDTTYSGALLRNDSEQIIWNVPKKGRISFQQGYRDRRQARNERGLAEIQAQISFCQDMMSRLRGERRQMIEDVEPKEDIEEITQRISSYSSQCKKLETEFFNTKGR